MKYNKIYFGVILIMLMLVSGVIAMTQHETETYNKIDNFISKIRYAIDKGLFLFTSWGQANCCSVYPDEEIWSYGTERVDCDDGDCSYDKCAIDSWAQSICLGSDCPRSHPSSPSYSNYIGEEKGVGASFRGYASNQWYFSEIYCCPKSCPIEPEAHDTKAYKCEDGEWDYKGRYDYDEHCSHAGSGNDYQCWCADEDDKFYIDETGGVHCRESARDSWCAPFEEHSYYTCYNNDIWWYDDNNNRNDKKEECDYDCVTGGDACNPEPEPEPECKSHRETCIPGLGQCCSGLTCFGICLGEEEYTKHHTKKCYSNDVYWYDSLNKRNDKYKECGTLGCSGGVCKEEEPEPEETCSESNGKCRGALIPGVLDACYETEIDIGKLDCKWPDSHCCVPKAEPEKTCADMGGKCRGALIPGVLDACYETETDIGKFDCNWPDSHCCVPEGEEPPEPPTSKCQSGADANNDDVISRSELGVYINKWVNNQVTRNKLGQSISEWVDGGC